MSDLISGKSLYEKIVEQEELARQRVLDTPTNSPCYQRYVAQLNERTAFKHMVFDEPTAYDVDAVVEQLEKKIEESYNESTSTGGIGGKSIAYGKNMAYHDAIDIVRKGGVE